jgi:ABC-type Mn2+/Zn2+ transport system permease subunit
LLGAAAAVAIAASLILYRPLLTLSFNEDKARLLGQNPQIAHGAMLALVTMAIVTAFRTVGSLLIFGLMIAPPATAALIARRVPVIMVTAVGLGTASVIGGLLISYHADTAGSATMAALAVAAFIIVLLIRRPGRA